MHRTGFRATGVGLVRRIERKRRRAVLLVEEAHFQDRGEILIREKKITNKAILFFFISTIFFNLESVKKGPCTESYSGH